MGKERGSVLLLISLKPYFKMVDWTENCDKMCLFQ